MCVKSPQITGDLKIFATLINNEKYGKPTSSLAILRHWKANKTKNLKTDLPLSKKMV